MTTELTQCPDCGKPSNNGRTCRLCDSEDALHKALTQRPAAQTEDDVFMPRRLAATQKLTQLGYHYDSMQGQWLPVPPQATPEPVGEVFHAADGGDDETGAGLHLKACIRWKNRGLLPAGTKLFIHPAPGVPSLNKDQIRKVFLDHGFTVKEGQADLKPYVYDAAEALLKRASPASVVHGGLQWFTVAEHGMPDFDEEVIGGFWYTDPWLKPEFETQFIWGLCRVFKDDHRDFKDGKRWYTFGPAHSDITHWARLNFPRKE